MGDGLIPAGITPAIRRRKGPPGRLPSLAWACGATVAVLVGGADAADSPLQRTTPGHQAPVPPGGYQLPMAPPVVRYPLPPQYVMIRSSEDWRKAGKVDEKLSRACANRAFRERSPLRYRAIFQKDILGVAFGHGDNLYDPAKLADVKKIYLFRNGDSTGCVVLAIDNMDAKILNDGGKQTPSR